MYSFICVVISLIISFLILFILAKTHILDLIGEIAGCGTMGIFRLGIVIAIFLASFFITKEIINPSDYEDTYLTTIIDLPIYEKIEKEPYGKEISMLETDSVIKALQMKNKKNITWIEGYILEKNEPQHIYVLIPAEVKSLKENSEYFVYNEKSKSFSAYYELIDKQNELIKTNIRKEFLKEMENSNIVITESSDNILKESIKKTHYILDSNGYFGLYKTDSSSFYYIKNEDKKSFKKIVSSFYTKQSDELKKYF